MRIRILFICFMALTAYHATQAQVVRYYTFNYYYPTTRIAFVTGEYKVVHQSGTVDSLHLQYFDYHRTFCAESLQNLSDSSRTTAFAAQSGDQLSYFTDLALSFSNYDDSAMIADTIRFTLELIDSDSGETLEAIDTLGVYPITGKEELHEAFIDEDTTIIDQYIIPSQYEGRNLAVRIGVAFSGPDSTSAICREDISSDVLLSGKAIFSMQYLESLIDTLVAEGVIDTSLSKRYNRILDSNMSKFTAIQFAVAPNPVGDRLTVHIGRRRDQQDTPVTAILVDARGRFISKWTLDNRKPETMDVSALPSGQYYLVPYADGMFYYGTSVTVLR
jgi:hypothetical protein